MACELLFRMFHAYRAVSVIDFKPGARCAPPGMLRCPPIIHFRRRIPGPFRGKFSGQDFWPLRLAAVEAGKWGCGRPGRRFHCDAYELVGQDGVGDHRQELSIVA